MAGDTGDEKFASVQRAVTAANACLVEVELGLRTGDRVRVVTAAATLYETWALLEALVASLKPRGRRVRQRPIESLRYEIFRYENARNALEASRYFAREVLAQAWAVLREGERRHGARRRLAAPPSKLAEDGDRG